MEDREVKWNDFKMNIELHRSYLELAIKLNMFHYAITGAMLSFHFANSSNPTAKLALVLPLLLSFGLGIFFFVGAKLASNLRVHIRTTAEELGLKAYPEAIVLVMLCYLFGGILALVAIGLGWYLVCS